MPRGYQCLHSEAPPSPSPCTRPDRPVDPQTSPCIIFRIFSFSPWRPYRRAGRPFPSLFYYPRSLKENMPFLNEFRPSHPDFCTRRGFVAHHAEQLFGNPDFVGRKVDIPGRFPAPFEVNICQACAGKGEKPRVCLPVRRVRAHGPEMQAPESVFR